VSGEVRVLVTGNGEKAFVHKERLGEQINTAYKGGRSPIRRNGKSKATMGNYLAGGWQ